MIELIGMLGGGIFRLIPELMNFFKARDDRAHEITMTKLQLDIDKARADQQIDLANAQGRIAMNQAEMSAMIEALKAQATPTGVTWVDAMSASVRPVLTYWWCMVLYTAFKTVTIVTAYKTGNFSLVEFGPMLMTEFDRTVIGSIFAFWFVDRALRNTK